MNAKDRPFTQWAAQICGFDKNLNAGLCPTCGKEVNAKDFRNEASASEFLLTQMCQQCQDEVFNG